VYLDLMEYLYPKRKTDISLGTGQKIRDTKIEAELAPKGKAGLKIA
jgi:hypothetical protein